MRSLNYNNDEQTLQFLFPREWADPTKVNIAISDTAGTSVLDATATTLIADDDLDGATASGANTITLTSGAGFVSGDVQRDDIDGWILRIEHSDAGRWEDCEVESYNSLTKVVTLKRDLQYAHSDEAVVRFRVCHYDLDTSTVATWPLGSAFTIVWTPTGIDHEPFTERARVEGYAFAAPGLRERFAAVYPAEFAMIETRWDAVYDTALQRVTLRLAALGHEINDCRQPGLVEEIVFETVCHLANAGRDDREDEYKRAAERLEGLWATTERSTLWWDKDMDLTIDNGTTADGTSEFSEIATNEWRPIGRAL